ncbi:multidrug/spermidine efflux SMR transporter subunit MdtI [Paenalcaligenes sp. Me131]|uniref:multidrug/spermidine efflux SMR transporter subunit MdtI n=1 Tax=Paenalcaligenes sp. Me131 TaxID=3392636 RepID=UPI003D265925
MQNAEWIHYFFMLAAILLEVTANIFIKYSDGFKKRWAGFLGIGSILLSFTALSQAVQGIDLSIAYALWGGTGIFLTTMAGRVFFQQRLNRSGYVGIGFIVLGASILKLA